jgi:hypoxanthine phosphoribosyltransferase
MKVKTLYTEDFNKECLLLGHDIFADYDPDVIIGVLNGGGYVGRQIVQVSPKETTYVEVKIQRDGTTKKEKGLIHRILQSLPYGVLNILRILESIVLEYKSKKNNTKRKGTIKLPDNVVSFLSDGENKKVLLVDDAIDSGATLLLIKQYLMSKFENIDVKIAVITITTKQPLVVADYYRYYNRTLIRFPWSNDIKKR